MCKSSQREEEKQKRLRLQEELNKMARKHYHTFLLHRRGVAPWKKFVDLCQANVRKADELSEEHVKKRTLARWQSVWARAVEEKEKTADKLHCRLLVQRMWRLWKSVSEGMDSAAVRLGEGLLLDVVVKVGLS